MSHSTKDLPTKDPLPYGKQLIEEDDLKAVHEALTSDYLTTGPRVEQFEEALCSVTGAKYAVACSNGTAALHLACLALELPSSFYALTSTMTFVASANCVEYCGGSVGFVDIDPTSLCIGVEQLASACESRVPDLVIPVHFTGVPSAPAEIKALSEKYGFRVIEDAAHSLGSEYEVGGVTHKTGSCAHADLATFSFHPVKTITTGEGGAVTTNDSELASRLRRYRSHGITRERGEMSRDDGPWYYEQIGLGYNYRITDMQCALGISQLAKLDSFRRRRSEIVDLYNKAFSSFSSLILPPKPKGSNPCYHLYPIQVVGGAKERLRVYEGLREQGIFTQVHYIPVHQQPYFVKKYGDQSSSFPNAEEYYAGCLSLPLFPAMTDDHVNRVIEVMKTLVN